MGKLENGKRPIGKNVAFKIITAFGVNERWLESGVGEMLINSSKNPELSLYSDKNQSLRKLSTNKSLPLLSIEAMTGFGADNWQIMPYDTEQYVIPSFNDADFLFAEIACILNTVMEMWWPVRSWPMILSFSGIKYTF